MGNPILSHEELLLLLGRDIAVAAVVAVFRSIWLLHSFVLVFGQRYGWLGR